MEEFQDFLLEQNNWKSIHSSVHREDVSRFILELQTNPIGLGITGQFYVTYGFIAKVQNIISTN